MNKNHNYNNVSKSLMTPITMSIAKFIKCNKKEKGVFLKDYKLSGIQYLQVANITYANLAS